MYSQLTPLTCTHLYPGFIFILFLTFLKKRCFYGLLYITNPSLIIVLNIIVHMSECVCVGWSNTLTGWQAHKQIGNHRHIDIQPGAPTHTDRCAQTNTLQSYSCCRSKYFWKYYHLHLLMYSFSKVWLMVYQVDILNFMNNRNYHLQYTK